jgi:hypothetical protein
MAWAFGFVVFWLVLNIGFAIALVVDYVRSLGVINDVEL